MRFVAGIDIGSGFTKAVIIRSSEDDVRPQLLGKGACKTGVDLEGAARTAMRTALSLSGVDPAAVAYVATTGLGRYSVSSRDIQVTEITTAAQGAHFLFPQSLCVLDIGSQATRAIGLTEEGRVRTFKTNDKCAAGSGSFIVRAVKYLEIDIEDVGELALQAVNPQAISSVCAVLAESEIINHVSAGVSVEDILRGIYDSLADRALNLLRRVGLGDQVTLIGGVARQQGMVKALEERLGIRVNTTPDAEYVCALGASLLGLKRLRATGRVAPPAQQAAGLA